MSDLPFIRNFYPGYVLEWPKDIDPALVPEINDAYVALFEEDIWYTQIVDAHTRLTAIDPNYRITQIKEKFGDLCFYFHTDNRGLWWDMQEVVNLAVKYARIATYRAAKRIVA